MRPLPSVDIKSEYVPLVGGDDLITPTMSADPGRSIITQNYELDVDGRYALIGGYEAFDGRPKPSEASYSLLNFDAGSVEIEVEDVVTGAGGASGEVIDVVVSSSDWAGGNAEGYIIIFNVTGTYVDDEVLSVSGSPVAVANGVAHDRGAPNDTYDNINHLAAIEATRADIGPVPGSGSLLGVWQYNGVKYAFRNNSGGTAAVMHKSSTSGWTEIDLGEYLEFTSGGTIEIAEEDVIEGETGGATATVKRVVLQSGTWAGADAAGYFILSGQTGTFQAETVKVGANLNLATIASDSTPQTLLPNGRYEFDNKNFRGHASTIRMYGCDGVNNAFEFDGTTYVPIKTGMTTDAPTHIIEHKKHLFLMFSGGSIQHSSLGEPYLWSAVTGAAEIALGDEGTGFLQMPNTLAIFTRNGTHILYGTSIDDWDLRTLENEAGAIEWSLQKIGSGIYLDDRGITSLAAIQEYGDFASNVLSKYIQPWLKTKLGSVQSSMRVKDKNQYRLFFDDMQAVTLTMDRNKVIGFTRQVYDKLPVCAFSTEDENGREELFFGSTDGYVYQMDKGNTFNGEALPSILKTHFNHLNTPRTNKGVRNIILELTAPINTYIAMNIEFDYGDTDNEPQTFLLDNPGGIWGVDNWDSFVWGKGDVTSLPVDIDGEGTNFSITLYNSGVFELQTEGLIEGFILPAILTETREGATGSDPHVIQGYIVDYDLRGRKV